MTDLAELKKRQQQTWASGDFSRVATSATIVGELLCEAVDLHAGQKVLDVATGSGNTALAAARRWGEVTGIDYVPALLERERAAVERLPITFLESDAENLSFPDASFDVVLSTFGAMFAPNQEKAASELLRVCRPGGKIGMTNWTPDGLAGEIFRVTTQHVPPPPDLKPPVLWGTEKRLRELFGDRIASLHITKRSLVFRYRSIEHWLEYFRTYFGPTLKAFQALDTKGQEKLAHDLTQLLNRFNRSGDQTMAAPSDYLEVVATKR
ncbi:class I SAM-dependent methyltransferase [Candidatus Acetothermia bacterium]|nr:class I SAM-dependent methyltransferase [Candidatus Acetothermia bacterium]